MARNINVEDAASWSKEELAANVYYLTQRCRWQELERIEDILGKDGLEEADVEIPESPDEEPEETPEGTNETADVPKTKKPTKSRAKKKG